MAWFKRWFPSINRRSAANVAVPYRHRSSFGRGDCGCHWNVVRLFKVSTSFGRFRAGRDNPRALAVGSLRSACTPAIHGLRSGCIHAPTAHSRRPSMSRRALRHFVECSLGRHRPRSLRRETSVCVASASEEMETVLPLHVGTSTEVPTAW